MKVDYTYIVLAILFFNTFLLTESAKDLFRNIKELTLILKRRESHLIGEKVSVIFFYLAFIVSNITIAGFALSYFGILRK